MKNLNTIKNFYNIEDNTLYKNTYLKLFANTFLSSEQKSEYKLYHQYVFRSNIVKEGILTYDYYLIKDKEFAWDLPELQNVIFERSSIFVGYIKPKRAKVYKELFLTLHKYEHNEYEVNGFTVKYKDLKYQYLFEDILDLGYRNFEYTISFCDDIEKSVVKWYKKLAK